MSWESLPQDVLSEGDRDARPATPRGGWACFEIAWTRSDRQLSWSAILENSSGPNAESSVQVDGGGDDEPAAPFADSAKPPLAVQRLQEVSATIAESARLTLKTSTASSHSRWSASRLVDAVAVADAGVELTAFATDVCDPLPAEARLEIRQFGANRLRGTVTRERIPVDADVEIDSRHVDAAAADEDRRRIGIRLLEPRGKRRGQCRTRRSR